jgi:hypothetical protein
MPIVPPPISWTVVDGRVLTLYTVELLASPISLPLPNAVQFFKVQSYNTSRRAKDFKDNWYVSFIQLGLY